MFAKIRHFVDQEYPNFTVLAFSEPIIVVTFFVITISPHLEYCPVITFSHKKTITNFQPKNDISYGFFKVFWGYAQSEPIWKSNKTNGLHTN